MNIHGLNNNYHQILNKSKQPHHQNTDKPVDETQLTKEKSFCKTIVEVPLLTYVEY